MHRKGKRWRKLGGGLLILRSGRKIRKGGIFWAEEAEIPGAFRDVLEELTPDKPPTKPKTTKRTTKPKTTKRTTKPKTTTSKTEGQGAG